MNPDEEKWHAEAILKEVVEQWANRKLAKMRSPPENDAKEMRSALNAYRLFAPLRAQSILEDPELSLEQMFFRAARDYLDYTDEIDPQQVQREISRKIPLGSFEQRAFVYEEGETNYEEIFLGPYSVFIATAQGPRGSMEDEHLVTELGTNKAPLFAIFDGHGGASCAQYAKQQLPLVLEKELSTCKTNSDLEIYNALRRTCIEIDRAWTALPVQHTVKRDPSGTTAAICLLLGKTLWVANVGDSRVVYIEQKKVVQLSEEAKVTVRKYRHEIYQRGGVTSQDRVIGETGTLNMARSVGDIDQPSISALPTIKKYGSLFKKKEDAYLVLACDGLWDVVDPKRAAKVCLEARTGSSAALKLLTTAFSQGTTDNVTVMVITSA